MALQRQYSRTGEATIAEVDAAGFERDQQRRLNFYARGYERLQAVARVGKKPLAVTIRRVCFDLVLTCESARPLSAYQDVRSSGKIIHRCGARRVCVQESGKQLQVFSEIKRCTPGW